MASCPTVIQVMYLLLLASTRSCHGDNLALFTNQAGMQHLTALKQVSSALSCVGDAMKQSMQLHAENSRTLQASLDIQRQNSDSLVAVGRLADVVIQMKEQLGQQHKDVISVKEELAAFHKAEKLALENEDLKLRLAIEETKVQNLENQLMQTAQNSQKQTDTEKLLNDTVAQLQRDLIGARSESYQNILKVQILEHSLSAVKAENEQNVMKVQDLGTKLKESEEKVEQLQEKLTHLNQSVQILEENMSTVKAENEQNVIKVQCPYKEAEETCNLPGKDQIRQLMLEYDKKKDWNTTKMGLEEVLDEGSDAYKQLKSVDYRTTETFFFVGYTSLKALAEVLVSCGRAVNITSTYGITMLYGAAYSGDVEMAKFLLDHCADMELGDKEGWTPLMQAAANGHLEFVKLLVNAGANISAFNNRGETALSLARENSRTDVEQYLSQLPH